MKIFISHSMILSGKDVIQEMIFLAKWKNKVFYSNLKRAICFAG